MCREGGAEEVSVCVEREGGREGGREREFLSVCFCVFTEESTKVKCRIKVQ